MNKWIYLFICNLFIISRTSSLFPSNDFNDRLEDIGFKTNSSHYRLPNTTIPLEYTITLMVDPNEDWFQGQTKIRIKCTSNTKEVVLHARQLIIKSTTVKTMTGSTIDVIATDLAEDDRNFYTIILDSELLGEQEYELIFEYDAPFGTGLFGLYKSYYNTTDGVKRYLAVTQFESTNARMAFPCYDEPALKAVFNIHIYAPNDYHSISNMDAITSNMPPIPDYNVTSFRSSPLMSSYLVAFVISDFDYKSNTRDGQIIFPREYRVYAKPSAKNKLDFALDYGQKCLMYLQNYTNVEYRLPKIDNVAVPHFSAGAMENWGLVTYREAYLFDDEKSEKSKFSIAKIMTHEQAHYWFGDEVSPLWWDYTWLNEGFASFFDNYITDKVTDNRWRQMENFPTTVMNQAMKYDQSHNAKPMSAPVNSPKEIMGTKFGVCSYKKAPSVIRMIQHVLGESVFQQSLSRYLKSLPTGVADQQKLFSEMQNVVGETNILPQGVTIGDIFGSWADQAGYPLLSVTRPNPSEIRITQQRYYENSTYVSNERWWIPLTWTTDQDQDTSNTTTQAWMTPNDSEVTIQIDPSTKLIIFNKQRCGYYRANYDKNMWYDLVQILNSENHHVIPPMTKALLIDDASAFSKTGRLAYRVTFGLLNYLSRETNWIPWTSATGVLKFLNSRMKTSKNYDLFKEFVYSILQNSAAVLMFNENDSYDSRQFNSLITKISCDFGFKNCLQIARDELNKLLKSEPHHYDEDLESIIYCTGLRLGSESLWNDTFVKYKTTSSETEKSIIINGLGCSQDSIIIDSYLKMTISDQSGIRPQDIESVVKSIIDSGSFGVERVIAFLQNNYFALKHSLQKSLVDIMSSLGDAISDEEQIEMFNFFVVTHDRIFTRKERTAIAKAKLTIDETISWRNNYMAEVEAWLKDNVNTNSINQF